MSCETCLDVGVEVWFQLYALATISRCRLLLFILGGSSSRECSLVVALHAADIVAPGATHEIGGTESGTGRTSWGSQVEDGQGQGKVFHGERISMSERGERGMGIGICLRSSWLKDNEQVLERPS